MRINEYTKDLMRKHLMTLDQALRIVKPCYSNRNMIQALQMAHWENTVEDEKRLVAAVIVQRNAAKIYYAGAKLGYQSKR